MTRITSQGAALDLLARIEEGMDLIEKAFLAEDVELGDDADNSPYRVKFLATSSRLAARAAEMRSFIDNAEGGKAGWAIMDLLVDVAAASEPHITIPLEEVVALAANLKGLDDFICDLTGDDSGGTIGGNLRPELDRVDGWLGVDSEKENEMWRIVNGRACLRTAVMIEDMEISAEKYRARADNYEKEAVAVA